MKLLLIARPSAHRNEVSAYLEQRGAEVEVRSGAAPSVFQTRGAVDAVVVLEDIERSGDGVGGGPADVPVIRWSGGNGRAAGSGHGGFPASLFGHGDVPALSSFDLRELAFRVAQAVYGTAHRTDAFRGATRRSRTLRAPSTAGADAA